LKKTLTRDLAGSGPIAAVPDYLVKDVFGTKQSQQASVGRSHQNRSLACPACSQYVVPKNISVYNDWRWAEEDISRESPARVREANSFEGASLMHARNGIAERLGGLLDRIVRRVSHLDQAT
jgi:hypothetical protein